MGRQPTLPFRSLDCSQRQGREAATRRVQASEGNAGLTMVQTNVLTLFFACLCLAIIWIHMSVASAYLKWALNKKRDKEHVFFVNLVRQFGLFDKESASRDFELLLNYLNLRICRRERELNNAFQDFRNTNGANFGRTDLFS
jgi:hypothetical protein